MHPFPIATIKTVSNRERPEVILVSFDRSPTHPIAPAFLFDSAPQLYARTPLAVLEWGWQEGAVWRFELANAPRDVNIGASYGYQAMWSASGFDAVADLDAVWVESDYPDDGTHEHCLLTYATISAYQGDRTGYRSDTHGWLTSDAYREHIALDRYGIRARIRNGRILGED